MLSNLLQWHIVSLGLLWIIYCVLHSWLASLTFKQWLTTHWPSVLSKYRIVFNTLALALLIPLLVLTFAWREPLLWQWTGIYRWFTDGLALAALGGFLWTLRSYDMQEFLGLRQWHRGGASVEDQESFHISPLHRFVRHPWYSLGLIILWTRNMDPMLLTVALIITLYLIIGSCLEEAKLLIYHGNVYERYRERVPALIPLPWKYLTAREAEELIEAAQPLRKTKHNNMPFPE